MCVKVTISTNLVTVAFPRRYGGEKIIKVAIASEKLDKPPNSHYLGTVCNDACSILALKNPYLTLVNREPLTFPKRAEVQCL